MNDNIPPDSSQSNGNAYKWKALTTLAVGAMMATMDASITNIAFPTLTKTFNKELTTVMWISVAFVLTSTSAMLTLGKIADLVGRKRIYVLGTAVFTLALFACSLSQSIGQLIFFRIIQALGAAMCISCATAIVTEAFPAEEIGRGLGLLGVSVSVGFIIGPVLGGFLLNWFDWRSIFYIRVPLGLIALLMALLLLKEKRPAGGAIKLDLLGTLTSSVGLFCFVFGVSQIRRLGLDSPFVLLLIGSGLLILAVFVLVEHRVDNPIVDLTLFNNQRFSGSTLSLLVLFISAAPIVLILPFYLMQSIRLNPSQAGFILAVHSATTMLAGPACGWLSDRFGPTWFATIGAGLVTLSFALSRNFDLQTPVMTIIPVLILSGIGVGAFQPSNNSMIMGNVARDRLGTASALIATMRQVGISVGMALAGTVFAARQAVYESELTVKGISPTEISRIAIPPAFHDALFIAVLLGLAATFLSFVTGIRTKELKAQR